MTMPKSMIFPLCPLIFLPLLLLPLTAATTYLFPTFTVTSERHIAFYTSPDALHFHLLPSTFASNTTLTRDPSPLIHNGTYYITYTTSWTGSSFGLVQSNDLHSWSVPTIVPLRLPSAARTWAPEFFLDVGGQVTIIVSVDVGGGRFRPYVLSALDDTLQSWSAPVEMAGMEGNYIDTFVVRVGDDEYHAFVKNEDTKYIEHAVARDLLGPWRVVQSSDFVGWGRVEGPCVVALEEGGYRLFADAYESGKYVYSDSRDLYHWTPVKELPGRLSGVVRHGTVYRAD